MKKKKRGLEESEKHNSIAVKKKKKDKRNKAWMFEEREKRPFGITIYITKNWKELHH
jgi:hypothetical protein